MLTLSTMYTSILRIRSLMNYFHREWDLNTVRANMRDVPPSVRHVLVMVYFSLLCVSASLAFGSYLGSAGYIQSLFTILAASVSAVCFCCIPLWIEVNPRVRLCLLNVVAFFGGASLAPWLIKSYDIDISFVVTPLLATCVGFGCFAIITKWTDGFPDVYWRSMLLCTLLIYAFLTLATMDIAAGAAHLITTMYVAVMWFMVYIAMYSQEVIFEANRGVEDYVIHAIRLFPSLLPVALHMARLWIQLMQDVE